MRAARLWMLLLGTSAAGIGVGALGQIAPLARQSLPPVLSAMLPRRSFPPGGSLDSLTAFVAATAPFRATRKPSTVAFDPKPLAQPADSTAAAPRPTLSLSGVVWGTVPTAVIQGLPGVEGSKVMRKGDVIGGITVSRIDRNRVWLTGVDTSWVLNLREPWK